jgi:hypothetical protein
MHHRFARLRLPLIAWLLPALEEMALAAQEAPV